MNSVCSSDTLLSLSGESSTCSLHLVEGEEKEIVCGAVDGYPHADFAWTSYRSEDGTLQTRNARMFNQHEDEFPDDSPSSMTTNRTGKV